MKSPRQLSLLLVLTLTALGSSTTAHSACGTSAVCDDVDASFVGTLILDGIRVEWESDDENSELDRYEIHRYDCETPSTCLVHVATLSPQGTCATTQEYEQFNNPPDPDSSWTYRIRVYKDGSSVIQCEFDVDPE